LNLLECQLVVFIGVFLVFSFYTDRIIFPFESEV
jgi:hypothetical protein